MQPDPIATAGAAALLTLAAPGTRNAIDNALRRAIAQALPRLGRDPEIYAVVLQSAVEGIFSVGGDVKELIELSRRGDGGAEAGLAEEYRLIWALECFTKPVVALIDGLVMGSGVGLTVFGTHRVAGEHYSFAMPETAIGFFPDVGMARVFASMPHRIGMYLALTGAPLGRADAFHLGLVTHCIPRIEFEFIVEGLMNADPVDPLLDVRHRDPGPAGILALADPIGRCFGADSVPGIVARLRAETGIHRDWAAATAETLLSRAPLATLVTHQFVRRAAALDLAGTLQLDYRLARRFLATADFSEGVRAMLIEKDRKPRWTPASLAEVSDADVDAMFASFPEAEELTLAARAALQAAGD